MERPLRLAFELTPERVDALVGRCGGGATSRKGPLKDVDPEALRKVLASMTDEADAPRWSDRKVFLSDLRRHLKAEGVRLPATALKAVWQDLSERDEDAEICLDPRGDAEPDVSLRDTENIPFGWAPPDETGDSRHGENHRDQVIAAYFAHEVEPHVPDAWIDHAKTRVGYEIPFTRHFYKYVPPRPLEEIDADLEVLVREIMELLREVEA